MILRCTLKLRHLLRVPSTSLVAVEPAPDDWYANLLYLERRKYAAPIELVRQQRQGPA